MCGLLVVKVVPGANRVGHDCVSNIQITFKKAPLSETSWLLFWVAENRTKIGMRHKQGPARETVDLWSESKQFESLNPENR